MKKRVQLKAGILDGPKKVVGNKLSKPENRDFHKIVAGAAQSAKDVAKGQKRRKKK